MNQKRNESKKKRIGQEWQRNVCCKKSNCYLFARVLLQWPLKRRQCERRYPLSSLATQWLSCERRSPLKIATLLLAILRAKIATKAIFALLSSLARICFSGTRAKIDTECYLRCSIFARKNLLQWHASAVILLSSLACH